MRTLLLAALTTLAAPALAQPVYDLTFFAHAPPSVISWNGQPALLLWSTQPAICRFEGGGNNSYTARVVLDVQLAMFVDSRGCSVGARAGISPNATWHQTHGIMPAGGVLFATTRHELRDLHREMSVTSTTYGVDYCPTILGCDGCGSRQREGPEMWALIATVQLW